MKVLIIASERMPEPEPGGLGREVHFLKLKGSPAFWTLDFLKKALRTMNVNQYDLIVVPGAFPQDLSPLAEELGVRVVKGPLSPVLLKLLLELDVIDLRDLDPKVPFEKRFPSVTSKLNLMLLDEIRRRPLRGVAFRLKDLKVPLRPPPLLVISEVYICDDEDVAKITRRIKEGADMIALGKEVGCEKERYLRLAKKVIDEVKVPVAVDPGDLSLMVELLSYGAELGMSLSPEQLERIPQDLRRDKGFVLIPLGPDPIVELKTAEERARRLGFRKVVLDPVAEPPISPGTLRSLKLLEELSKTTSSPILYGVCNVVELLDADSTGATLLLTSLALEAGASLILVVEKSPKTLWNTLEARIASNMASLASILGTPPKDVHPFSLLALKAKEFRYVRPCGRKLLIAIKDKKVIAECDPKNLVKVLSEALGYVEDRHEVLKLIREVMTSCLPELLRPLYSE